MCIKLSLSEHPTLITSRCRATELPVMRTADIIFFVVFQVAAYCHLSFSQSQKWDLQFNFDGYVRQNKDFLMKSCPTNIKDNVAQTEKMIDASLQKDAVEFPTTNTDKIHLQCVKDSLMGSVVNFTIYRDGDNDYTGNKDRQRMEMKGKEDGKKGTSFIFAWWFKLDPKMKNTYDDFYHIFQIKTGGSGSLSKFPLATLSLSEKDKFNLHPNYLNRYGDKPYKLLNLQDVKGKWIQVFVEAVFKKQNDGGYIRVMLKDEKGKDLVKEMKVPHEMWWDGANFRPKWGLYRKKSPKVYQFSDWQLFQNVQIWKKN